MPKPQDVPTAEPHNDAVTRQQGYSLTSTCGMPYDVIFV